MAKKATRSVTPLGTLLDSEVVAALRQYADSRGETIRSVLEMAIRRHLASPPPKVELAPLPPLPTGKRA